MLYVVYTDYSILEGPNKDKIDITIKHINDESGLNITGEGCLNEFIGVDINKQNDGKFL